MVSLEIAYLSYSAYFTFGKKCLIGSFLKGKGYFGLIRIQKLKSITAIPCCLWLAAQHFMVRILERVGCSLHCGQVVRENGLFPIFLNMPLPMCYLPSTGYHHVNINHVQQSIGWDKDFNIGNVTGISRTTSQHQIERKSTRDDDGT